MGLQISIRDGAEYVGLHELLKQLPFDGLARREHRKLEMIAAMAKGWLFESFCSDFGAIPPSNTWPFERDENGQYVQMLTRKLYAEWMTTLRHVVDSRGDILGDDKNV